jgi:hypothetical protein
MAQNSFMKPPSAFEFRHSLLQLSKSLDCLRSTRQSGERSQKAVHRHESEAERDFGKTADLMLTVASPSADSYREFDDFTDLISRTLQGAHEVSVATLVIALGLLVEYPVIAGDSIKTRTRRRPSKPHSCVAWPYRFSYSQLTCRSHK